MFVHIILVRFMLLILATFWERAAQSVDHMFSLYFDFFVILVISRFSFEGSIWVLIAPVPGHCLLVTFFYQTLRQRVIL